MICRYIRDLLLNPPPFDVASAVQGKICSTLHSYFFLDRFSFFGFLQFPGVGTLSSMWKIIFILFTISYIYHGN